ncbi:hypothetical protein OH768_35260 [Streptomyces sp. NBC_01622]|nr:hypothetical protein OH768_35260 [Streptomyces sp. NBC_01622]
MPGGVVCGDATRLPTTVDKDDAYFVEDSGIARLRAAARAGGAR